MVDRIVETADFHYQMDKCYQMLSNLIDLENTIFAKWAAKVPDRCLKNLAKTILIKNEDTLDIGLNFDDEVSEGVNTSICLLYSSLAVNCIQRWRLVLFM